MASPVALILGAGSNAGQGTVRAFAAKGYRTALVSRSLRAEDSTDTQLHIPADLSDPESVAGIFSKVKSSWGSPSVVVYNAAAVNPTDPKDPLSSPLSTFSKHLNINTTSLYAAAQQAVLGFKELPSSTSPTFIYTGNITNVKAIAPILDLGAGKSAGAHIIEIAAEAYQDKKYKFYYADERHDDGSPMLGGISGPEVGKFYTELAEGDSQGPWYQTFVAGKGFKKF